MRTSSTFLSLESAIGGLNDDFANKLLGQWLVYSVIHSFTETDYNNKITAVRLHANDNINIKNNIT